MQKQKTTIPKRILSFLLVTMMVLTMLPMMEITAFADTPRTKLGTTDTYYELTGGDKTLTISGTGAMPDFSGNTSPPWENVMSNLTIIIVENGVTSIGVSAFAQASNVSSVTIADSVTEINAFAFSFNTSLSSISLPAGITNISDDVFAFCSALNDITFNGTTPPTVNSGAFSGCPGAGTVHVPVGKADDYLGALIRKGIDVEQWTIIGDVGSNAPPTPNDTGGGNSHGNNSHQHYYQWTILSDASVSEDGVEQYKCYCGDVKETLIIPASQAYIKELYGEIKNAPQDAVVEYNTGRWTGINDYVIKKLADRADVSIRITFEYEKVRYTFTLPAGISYEVLLQDQETYYGFFTFCKLLEIPVSQL